MKPRRRIVLGAAGAALFAGALWIRCGPIPADLVARASLPSTMVVDRRGRPLYEALSASGARLERIEPDALPATLATATMAAEDRRFWSHPGVDLYALVRAAKHNLAERHIVEGGSTITQQIAKLLLQGRDGGARRGVGAKIREAVLALRLEHRYTKRELLAMYLNLAAYGNQVSGAARASRLYFGVSPGMLTPAQAAFIAALPQRPSAFNPWRSTSAAIARQRQVLSRMKAMNGLTADQYAAAMEERLDLDSRHASFAAPHFTEMVLSRMPAPRPARIDTTLDLDLQHDVEGIIQRQRPALLAHGASNVAVVVLDNRTGEWLAWEGSGDYFDARHGGAINGPLEARQPGSALKPFTYALAFEQGDGPATVLPDIPASFPTAEAGVLYTPRNYDGLYRGPLRARKALAGSENVPAVALASNLGVSNLLRFLTRAGFTTFDRTASYYGLGLTLGNAEVRLDELVAAYSVFATGGIYREPTAVKAVQSNRAERVVLSPRTAFLVSDILSDPEARSFIFGRGGNLEFPFPVAVKTGTSQAYHDNWTVGFTRDVTVGVWVGNFDRTPLRDSSGVTGAGPLFHAVMLAAVERTGGPRADVEPVVSQPVQLVRASICALSGMRATASCPTRESEWVRIDADPVPCSWHHQSDDGVLTIYPPEYRAWAAAHEPQHVRPAATAESAPSHVRRGLAIISPAAGTIYSIDPTLRREFQALSLRAVSDAPTVLDWYVDGEHVGSSSSERSLGWPLAVGTHAIEARAAGGRSARTSVIVK